MGMSALWYSNIVRIVLSINLLRILDSHNVFQQSSAVILQVSLPIHVNVGASRVFFDSFRVHEVGESHLVREL